MQSREGLSIGLGVTVRYRLDPNKLATVQAHLPQPADKELVPPIVASAWRSLAPEYTVREIFSSKREEVRARAAAIITRKLDADGMVVEEVMLSEIRLPEQYARGLEGLLLKEQEDDQLGVVTEIQQKQVRIAELQAEAEAAQKVKRAEGDAKSKVVEAKGEADAMQYTLPLKQKQIEQRQLEAEAEKRARIRTAEGAAEARRIEARGEADSRQKLAEAEAYGLEIVGKSNAGQMEREGELIARYPLLIQKTLADKLSDKVQVIIAPSPAPGQFLGANLVGLESAKVPSAAPLSVTAQAQGR